MNLLKNIFVSLLLMALIGCQPSINNSGNRCDSEDLKTLKVGIHNIDDVYSILGTPSFKFSSERVMYLGRNLKHVAFFRPTVSDEVAVVVSFNQYGLLKGYEIVKLSPKNINPDQTVTPVQGTGRNTADHILDNLHKKTNK